MIRSCCCLALSCLFTACAPRKAAEVAEANPAPVRNTKPVDAGNAPALPPPGRESGMQLPPVEGLPDRRDMTPTTAVTTGSGVIATPPTADRKPLSE
jgi:hypothetical protein